MKLLLQVRLPVSVDLIEDLTDMLAKRTGEKILISQKGNVILFSEGGQK